MFFSYYRSQITSVTILFISKLLNQNFVELKRIYAHVFEYICWEFSFSHIIECTNSTFWFSVHLFCSSGSLGVKLKELFLDMEWTDMEIITNEGTVPVHGFIIHSRCPRLYEVWKITSIRICPKLYASSVAKFDQNLKDTVYISRLEILCIPSLGTCT